MIKSCFIFLFFLCFDQVFSVDFGDYLAQKKGVSAYEAEDYDTASAVFQKAFDQQSDSPVLGYNLANTFYQQKDYDQAISYYQEALGNLDMRSDSVLAANSLYNLGNAFFQKGEVEQAIDFYKQSLSLNPTDPDVKHNLELSLAYLKQQQEQQKQQNQDRQDQNQDEDQNKDQNQDQQQGKDDQEQEGENQQEDQQDQSQGQESPSSDSEAQDQNDLTQSDDSSSDAEEGLSDEGMAESGDEQEVQGSSSSHSILNALEEIEKNVKIKYQKQDVQSADVEFDW